MSSQPKIARMELEIRGELLRGIFNSKIYVPIFSKEYASSNCCRLAYMEHWKGDEKVILSIFIEVDDSDVKLITGPYGMALQKHEGE